MDVKRIDVNAKLKLYETSIKEKSDVKSYADANKNAALKSESQDKINISREAKNLSILDFVKSKIKAEINRDLSEIENIEKINALREQIKAGEYYINSGDIAAAIISARA